jgi:NIPSNAP
MVMQVRIYKIHPGRMDEWLAAWRGSIVPLRRKFGFEVVGAWVNRESDRFVWVLGLPASDDWDARDRAYYESRERRALRPDPADCVAEQETFLDESVRVP